METRSCINCTYFIMAIYYEAKNKERETVRSISRFKNERREENIDTPIER